MRIRSVSAVLAIACASGGVHGAAAQRPVPRDRVAIEHVNVVDVQNGAVRRDQTVTIADGRITAVVPTSAARLSPGTRRVSGVKRFLIPGLWDMHAHSDSAELTRRMIVPLELANGITGVRDMFGTPDVLTVRREIRAGRLVGPRMVIGSAILDGPRPMWEGSVPVSTAADGKRVVDSLVAQGYDFIKIYSFLSRAAFDAIAAEARVRSIRFAGHVPMSVSVGDASDAGQQSIEHGIGLSLACSANEDALRRRFVTDVEGIPAAFGPHAALLGRSEYEPLATYDAAKCAAVFSKLARNGTWVVPTLIVHRAHAYALDAATRHDARLRYMDAGTRASWAAYAANRPPVIDSMFRAAYPASIESIAAMHRAHVRILAGSDALNPFVIPGFALHEELELLVKGGLTPLEALQSATINPAEFLGGSDSLGTIEAGKLADLVLLDANPLTDIRNATRIRAVVAGGHYLDRNALDALLAGAVKFSKPKDVVLPNDNRVPAGSLQGHTLALHLDAREGMWYPDGSSNPGLPIAVFAEAGHRAQNPGPLIRVSAGTRVRVSVRNSLRDSTLVVYGLHSRPSSLDDTIQVRAGAEREVVFEAGAPGTYFYWATTMHKGVADRDGYDSQLHGAFIIDSAGRAPRPDRIFVLGDWIAGPSSTAPQLRVINGLSWPQTERLSYTAGDTVRWRWVNPSESPHPMHLHGFYFDVTSRGTYAADTIITMPDRPHVVTEMPLPGGTFMMNWVPDEPGEWLFHCHVAFHTSMFLSPLEVADPVDPVALDPMKDMAASMRGMVLAVTVRPGASLARRPAIVKGARALRVEMRAAPKRYGDLDGLVFVSRDGSPASTGDSVPALSSMLVLMRGEPVRITVVNHTRAPTGVHWHGIEVPAYSDGVPGMSGVAAHRAPMIAPGDSFTASFTPTRSGTFMYHAHSNESYQLSLGLYGALLVVDSGHYDPAHERVIITGGNGLGGKPARINGKLDPDTLRLKAGETYRIRLVDIISDWTTRVTLTRDDSIVHWKLLAKDGAEMPARLQLTQSATFISGPGQTRDFEFTPTTPGAMRLDVNQRTGSWKTHLAIVVER
jgi:manganese oxidase